MTTRLAALAVAALLLAACGGGAPRGPTPTPTVGKYTQTWTKSYATTTCVDWVDAMDAHERFVMAGDMLMGAQGTDVPNPPLPPDRQINAMRDGIHDVCSDSGYQLAMRVTELATTLYLLADDLKPGR